MRRFVFQSHDSSSGADEPLYFAPGRLSLSRAKRSRHLFRRAILASIAGFGIACALALHHAENPVSSGYSAATVQPPPPPAWIGVASPAELFSITAPEFAGEAKIYAARRHRTGGGRQDILVLGNLNGSGPFLRLVLYRVGDEGRAPGAFFVDLARHAAETGRAITFAAQPTALQTRLGLFEAADLSLTQAGSADTPCLGFRMAQPAKLRLTGVVCSGGGKADAAFASKAKLACLLDSLELAPSVDDKELAAFFAARELNDHTACTETSGTPSNWFTTPSSGAQRQKPVEHPIKSP